MENNLKFGFSTLGCPEWEWDDCLTAASDLGFDGVEIRGVGRHIYLPSAPQFSGSGITAVKAALKRLKLKIPCLASGALLFDKSRAEAAIEEATGYINCAATLGAPYVRVLADRNPAPGHVDEDCVKENLRHLLPIAAEAGVSLLVETNGVYAESAKLAELCESIGDKNLGVLWDIHHPYRFFREAPETTFQNLKQYIRHIHVKDSSREDGIVRYRLTGAGDVPLFDAIKILIANNYDGFVVLEWVRRWDYTLEEPGIVFPHFINAMRNLEI